MRKPKRGGLLWLLGTVLAAHTWAQGTTPLPAHQANPLLDPRVASMADGHTRPDPELGPGVTAAYLPILYPSSHASNLLPLRNGDLLCVWFSGSWEGNSDVGIVLSRLPKGSSTWSKPQLIDRHPGESYQNPVLFQAPDGVLHLYHTTQGAGVGEAGAIVLTLDSHDNGHTWSAPKPLFRKPGAFTRHPVVVLADGTWLLPLTYVTSRGIGEGSETNYSAMELSRDGGRTWRECKVEGSEGRIQPTVVELAPHRLLALFRSRSSDWIYQSTSQDGCTWTPPVPTQLPNNNASVQMFRLADGHLVVAFDNSSRDDSGAKPTSAVRKPLSVALSDDEGRTWSFVRDLERGRPGYGQAEAKPKTPGREEYSYPSVTQVADGHIYVSFTYRRQTIKVLCFEEAWIREGSTVGQYKPPR